MAKDINIPQYYTVSEVAQKLGVSKTSVHRLIKGKELKASNLHKRMTRINHEDLIKFIHNATK